MKTQSAKAKGRKLQQIVRDKILQKYPQLTSRDVRSTSMGAAGVDILLSERAYSNFPFDVECKSRARMAVYDLYNDAVDNNTHVGYPLLVIKQNNSEPLVVLSLDHFMEILK